MICQFDKDVFVLWQVLALDHQLIQDTIRFVKQLYCNLTMVESIPTESLSLRDVLASDKTSDTEEEEEDSAKTEEENTKKVGARRTFDQC